MRIYYRSGPVAKLMNLWRFLEKRNSKTAVISEWKQRLDGEFVAVEPLLTPTDRMAESYPNPSPGGIPLKVVVHADESIVALCQDGTKLRLKLQHDDIVCWQLQVDRLRKTLADALGIRVACGEIDSKSDLLLLGKYRPKLAAEFSVYLLIVKRSFSAVIKELCQPKSSCIILLTSIQQCDDGELDLIRKSGSIYATAEDVIEVEGDSITKSTKWNECLATFAHAVNPSGRSNFCNKPRKKGQKTAANIQKLKNALKEHIYAEYDRIHSQRQRGFDVTPAPVLEKQELGNLIGIRPDAVTRAFQAELELDQLYKITLSNEDIMKYGKRPSR
jgi:hypothetical protein